MNRRWFSGLCLAILVIGVVPAFAQTVIGAKSGVINWVEGDVFLADKPYVMQPSVFGEVKENMTLRTEEGRAEVLLPPGVFFRMGEKSSFRMITNRLIDTRVELLTGSAVVEIADLAKEATVTVVAKDGTISLNKVGIYRVDAEPAQIKVFKGTADVALHGETIAVAAGKMLSLSGAVASAEKFNPADTDSLDHWSRRRGELLANANISAAKQANGSSYGSADPCYGYGGYRTGPFARPWGTWGYNPYYGFGTYIPCSGTMTSPYGYRYWSPIAVYRAFYAPRPTYAPPMGGGGFGGFPSYGSYGGTSGGYSGSTGASSGGFSGASAPAASASAGSTASSAGSSSAGHGSAAGGGHR
jgi:hypothetical protein